MSVKKREVLLKNAQRRTYYDVRCWMQGPNGGRRQHHERGFLRKSDAEARQNEIRDRNGRGQAVRRRILDRNVAEDLDPPRHNVFEARALTEDEIYRLLEATESTWLSAFVWLALDSGGRSGELLGLRWTEIDPDAGVVYIAHSVRRQRGEGIVEGTTKTHGSRRALQIHLATVNVLRGPSARPA